MFYIKKLYANELGYRKGIPKKAGRFFLVSKKAYDFFPVLNEETDNPSETISIINNISNTRHYCEYTKSTATGHLGKDLRIYLNEEIDPLGTYFNPDDYVVLQKLNIENEGPIYRLFKYIASDKPYEILEKINRGQANHLIVNDVDFIRDENITFKETKISTRTRAKIKDRRSKLFKNDCESEHEFRMIVREEYSYKCAMSGSYINTEDSSIIAEASHIRPASHHGPLSPNNAILMRSDLHLAFDCGLITLDDDFRITVHPTQSENYLNELNEKEMHFPTNEENYPSLEFIKYHREQIYGQLKHVRYIPYNT